MTTLPIVLAALCVGAFNYGVWGKYLRNTIAKPDDSRPTPAHTKRDDVDFAPQDKVIVLGYHWPAIAGLDLLVLLLQLFGLAAWDNLPSSG